MVSELEFDAKGAVVRCQIEAITSNRSEQIEWESLRNADNWLQGWK